MIVAVGSGINIRRKTAGASFEVYVGTNSRGKIISWFVGGYADDNNIQLQTNWKSPFSFQPGEEFSETTASFAGSYGFVSDDPGVWKRGKATAASTATSVAGVPEASTWVMMLAGFAVLGLAGYRASRKVGPTVG